MSVEHLSDRAGMFAKVRAFFAAREVMEVDCPALRDYPSCDPNIESIRAGDGYLHTSPEYAMKALIAQGSGDIYQLGHVFRAGEKGERHQPEFSMIEWYRVGFSLDELIAETLELIRMFVGDHPVSRFTYADLFERFDCEPSDYNLVTYVELNLKGFTVVTNYPAEQAALAKIENGTARRFEVYFNDLELANGYDEVTDPSELEKRFPGIDPAVLVELPQCCGVAVGFDRLMMARRGESDICNVIASAAQSESGVR